MFTCAPAHQSEEDLTASSAQVKAASFMINGGSKQQKEPNVRTLEAQETPLAEATSPVVQEDVGRQVLIGGQREI